VLLISWKLVFWCSRWSNSNCQSDLKDGHSWSLSVPMSVTWWWSASPLEGSCWDDLGSVYSMVGLGWFHISLDTREGVTSFLGFVHSQDSTLAYSPVGCYAAKWDQLLMGIFCFTPISLHLIYSWNICDIQVNLVQKNFIKDAMLRESTGAYITFVVKTKLHGHGDVHVLLHSKGLLPKWYCILTMLELHVITCSWTALVA
jgi:hypothetical protein